MPASEIRAWSQIGINEIISLCTNRNVLQLYSDYEH